MLLNEIIDPNDPIHAQRQNAMNRIRQQYAPAKTQSREDQFGHKRRNSEYELRRKRIESALAAIAQKYSGSQFEEFKSEAEHTLSPDELGIVDLTWAFDFFNPDKKAEHEKSWQSYGEERAKSSAEGGSNPAIHGMGYGGARNWTGD